jgi:hypothetical protein
MDLNSLTPRMTKKMNNVMYNCAPIRLQGNKIWLRLVHNTSESNRDSIRRNGLNRHTEDKVENIIRFYNDQLKTPLSPDEKRLIDGGCFGAAFRREQGELIHACTSWGMGLVTAKGYSVAAVGGELTASVRNSIARLRPNEPLYDNQDKAILVLFQVAFDIENFLSDFPIRCGGHTVEESAQIFNSFLEGVVRNKEILATASSLEGHTDYVENSLGGKFLSLDDFDDLQIEGSITPRNILAFYRRDDLNNDRGLNKVPFLVDE